MKADDLAGEKLRSAPATSHLVLFAGLGTQAEREISELLTRAGMRGLWLGPPARALAAAAHARFDVAVFAVDEPMATAARDFDRWRRTLRCPLLVLADGSDEVDEIIALELGADAVLPRSVSARRLRAQLLTLTRGAPTSVAAAAQAAAAPARPPAQAEGWTLDRVLNRLVKGARVVDLTQTQAALLQVLMDDAPRVVPRARLLGAVAGGRELNARSVDVYVARLRQRLRERHVDDLQVDGVRGRGYALVRTPNPLGESIEALRRWHPPLGWSAAAAAAAADVAG